MSAKPDCAVEQGLCIVNLVPETCARLSRHPVRPRRPGTAAGRGAVTSAGGACRPSAALLYEGLLRASPPCGDGPYQNATGLQMGIFRECGPTRPESAAQPAGQGQPVRVERSEPRGGGLEGTAQRSYPQPATLGAADHLTYDHPRRATSLRSGKSLMGRPCDSRAPRTSTRSRFAGLARA